MSVQGFVRRLTLQQGGSCRHSFWYAILAVNGLKELWNAVVFINNNNSHLREGN